MLTDNRKIILESARSDITKPFILIPSNKTPNKLYRKYNSLHNIC